MQHHAAHTQAPHSNRNDLNNLKSIFPLLRDYFGRVLIALACLILAKVANVGIPLLLKEIVDYLDSNIQEQLILPLFLLLSYGLLRLAGSLFNELRDSIFARVRYRAMRRLSTRLLEHLYALSLRFHLERHTGAISRDLERGTRSVSTLLNFITFSILPTLFEFSLVTIVLILNYDYKFILVTLTTAAIYIWFTFKLSEWRMHFRHSMNALESKANSQAIDGLINYETVKYFGNESLELSRYDETLHKWENDAVKTQASMSVLNFGQSAIIAIGVTLIMILASSEVINGTLSIGDLVLINAYLLQLFIPLGFLGVVYRQTLHSLADMDSMFKLLQKNPEICDAEPTKNIIVNSGHVSFENVDFFYDKSRPILHNLNFEIPPGKKFAIVGPSGSGKSTLVRLLYRFYDTTHGHIKIDGQDISQVTQQSLRDSIGIVPQDTVLFNDTLMYNLTYANPLSSMETIEQSAKTANIHNFIMSLPNSYQTVVGERGLKLSGGEKQRIAIARVVLKNPKIMIFDEATSALDSKSEKVILTALREVAKNHTTLVIAHRLSTVVDADQILVMEHGRIIERGTHQQLLHNNSTYSQMWTLQEKQMKQENTTNTGNT